MPARTDSPPKSEESERASLHERLGGVRHVAALLEPIVENIPDMIFVKDAEHLRFVLFNRAAEDLLGRSREELVGRSDYDFFPKEQADFFTARDRQVLEEKRLVLIPEEPIDTPHRGQLTLRTRKVPVLDQTGTPRFLLGISEDITEQKRALEELQRSERQKRLLGEVGIALVSGLDLAESLPVSARLLVPVIADACVIRVADVTGWPGLIASADVSEDSGRKLLRVAEAESLASRTPRVFSEVEDRREPRLYAEVRDADLRAFALSEDHYQALHALGFRSAMLLALVARGVFLGTLTLAFTSSGRRYDEQDLEFAKHLAARLAHDLDNARLYREAQQALADRDTFLSIAAHELRTPLTPLKLQLQTARRLIGEAPDAAALGRKIDVASRQVDRLQRLVQSLLDVSRIAVGQFELHLEEVSPAELVAEILERFSDEAQAAGCEIRLTAGEVGPAHWDRLRVEQILSNLLVNALKYAPGSPLDVDVEPLDGAVRLSVRDHGPGLIEGEDARIFHRFERAASERAQGGLGLGLFIVRKIVDAHGGDVRFEAPPDGGARFVVELPLHPAGGAAEAP